MEAELLATQDWVELESTQGAIANAAHMASRRSVAAASGGGATTVPSIVNARLPAGEIPDLVLQNQFAGVQEPSETAAGATEVRAYGDRLESRTLTNTSVDERSATATPRVGTNGETLPMPVEAWVASVARDSTASSAAIVEEAPGADDVFAHYKWVGLQFTMNLENVTLQLLDNEDGMPEVSLARFDLVDSKLSFTGFTDGTPRDLGSDITFFSRAVVVHDSRAQDLHRANYFTTIFAPMSTTGVNSTAAAGSGDRLSGGAATPVTPQTATSSSRDAQGGEGPPQVQLTQRNSPGSSRIKVLMNKARLVVSPEWTMALLKYLDSRPASGLMRFHALHGARIRNRYLTSAGWSGQPSRSMEQVPPAEPKKNEELQLSVVVTDPEFVLVNDTSKADSEAVVLTFCSALSYHQIPGATGDAGPKSSGRNPGFRDVTLSTETMELVLDVSFFFLPAFSGKDVLPSPFSSNRLTLLYFPRLNLLY